MSDKIKFIQEEGIFDGEKGVDIFFAKIKCRISSDALADNFKAEFKKNRINIENMAERLILKGRFEDDGSILIKKSDFF